MDLAGAKTKFIGAVDRFQGTTVAQLRQFLTDAGHPAGNVNRMLEHHARRYVLDQLLIALGWVIDPVADNHVNLMPEVYLKSGQSTQFLDYLGADESFNVPLLVFEAKRFGLDPPSTLAALYNQKGSGQSARARVTKSVKEALAAAATASAAPRGPKWLTGEWKEHFKQLRQYFENTVNKFGRAPLAMAIADGRWMVIIVDPAAVFAGTPAADSFVVIQDGATGPGDAYIAAFETIHSHLAYARLGTAAPFLPPEWIPRQLRASKHVEIARGLRVSYTNTDTPLRAGMRPHIDVSPVVFLREAPQPWVCVEAAAEGIPLPPNSSGSVQLDDHLATTKAASTALVARVVRLLAVPPVERDLPSLEHEEHTFGLGGFVRKERHVPGAKAQTYVMVTGTKTHFLESKPRIDPCQYHDWSACHAGGFGVYPDRPLAAPSYGAVRAYFPSGRPHHCAADATFRLKSAPAATASQMAQGVRPPISDTVFCRLYDFEGLLCCQTCAFLEVCAKSPHFKLPCM